MTSGPVRWDDASDEQVLAAYVNATDPPSRNAAFHELVDRFERRVYAICLRYFGNRADAEDATQNTFMAVVRRAETFAGNSKLSTWLYRVAVNACNDLARKRSRRPQTTVAEVDVLAEDERGPSDAISGRETQLEVQRALLELDETSRALVILVAIEGRPYQEVAAALDLPIGTVKSRVHRARSKLVELLTPVLEGREPDGTHGVPSASNLMKERPQPGGGNPSR